MSGMFDIGEPAPADWREGPDQGRGARLAGAFVRLARGRLLGGEDFDVAALAATLGASVRRVVTALRTFERHFYETQVAHRVAPKPKYPGGGRGIAADVVARVRVALAMKNPFSVRKIAEGLGVSAQRAIVALQRWEPEFYAAHVQGRPGRKTVDAQGRHIPAAGPKKERPVQRPLTAKQHEAGRIFLERLAGKSWADAVAGTAISASNAPAHVRAWGRKTGTDVTQAFTRRPADRL